MGSSTSLSILVFRIATSTLLYRIPIPASSTVVGGSRGLYQAMDRSIPTFLDLLYLLSIHPIRRSRPFLSPYFCAVAQKLYT